VRRSEGEEGKGGGTFYSAKPDGIKKKKGRGQAIHEAREPRSHASLCCGTVKSEGAGKHQKRGPKGGERARVERGVQPERRETGGKVGPVNLKQ